MSLTNDPHTTHRHHTSITHTHIACHIASQSHLLFYSCRIIDQERSGKMEYRRMGKTGLKISTFSYGAWVSFANQ